MNLLGKGNDPKFWSETVRNEKHFEFYRKWLLDKWEEVCVNDDMQALYYSEFRLYAITGDRMIFQKPYYRRRVQVETAVILALIYPEEEKYLNYAMDKIFEICNEYSWCIPAHLPNLIVRNNRKRLDLFACETAFILAQIYTLLGDRLEPLIRNRIKYEVKVRLVDSVFEKTDWNWETINRANWAAVCGGSVGCTFMLLFPELFDQIKHRIDRSMENYLSGFEDDGFCSEGTHYWHYGFGFFCVYADMLEKFKGESYFERPKVKEIANFLQKVFLSGSSSVSFADASDDLEYHIGLLHFLKNKYETVKVYDPKYSYILDACGRFCWLITAATWFDKDIYENPEPDDGASEYYGDDTQWLIKRTNCYGFAGKAGHNAEQHNHNDVGAFIIAKNGTQLVIDTGSGVYSQQYFDLKTRYSFIECSSLGHSVPFFGDLAQALGKEFSAKDVKWENGIFSFDLAGAYDSDEVKSIKRTFSFTDETITLNDKFDYTGSAPITDRIVLSVPAVIEKDRIVCDNLVIKYDPTECTPSISTVETSKKLTLYMVDFTLNDGNTNVTLKFE